MTCDKHKENLIDAAAGGALVDRELALHLEHCDRCRATLQRERELFSAIDNGLRVPLVTQPGPGFLPKLHAQMERNASTRSRRTSMWALAGAAAVVVVIALMHPWTGPRKPTAGGHERAAVAPAQERPSVAEVAEVKKSVSARRQRTVPVRRRSVIDQVADREPEVLVPPDEAKAFAQFVARVAGRDVRAEAVVRPMRDQAGEPKELLELPLVDIADLQHESLGSGEE